MAVINTCTSRMASVGASNPSLFARASLSAMASCSAITRSCSMS